MDISQHTVVTHLQFCLPTVPQSGISIGAVNLDRFEEDEDDDDICEIGDQEDGKKCDLAYRDCGCSQEVVCTGWTPIDTSANEIPIRIGKKPEFHPPLFGMLGSLDSLEFSEACSVDIETFYLEGLDHQPVHSTIGF